MKLFRESKMAVGMQESGLKYSHSSNTPELHPICNIIVLTMIMVDGQSSNRKANSIIDYKNFSEKLSLLNVQHLRRVRKKFCTSYKKPQLHITSVTPRAHQTRSEDSSTRSKLDVELLVKQRTTTHRSWTSWSDRLPSMWPLPMGQ